MESKQTTIRLSVLVAVCNVGRFLRTCLESLAAQDGADVEFVCVDDGSTDGSASILNEFAARDSRFRVIRQENRGTLLARKAGVEQARGKYLMFVDGDDELASDAASRAVAAIEQENADLVNFGVKFLSCAPDMDFAPYEKYFQTSPGRISGPNDYGVLRACVTDRRYTWNLWNKIWRTDIAKCAASELPDVRIVQGDDLYLVFLMLARARVAAIVPDTLYHYRVDSGVSTDGKMNEAKFRRYCDYVEICRQLRQWVSSQSPDENLAACLESVLVNTANLFDGIFAHRLPQACRGVCLALFYQACRQADLVRLVQGCKGMSATDLDLMLSKEAFHDLPKPVFDRTDAAVCIVSSDEYAPYAATVVTSVVVNAKPELNYDIVLLTESMTPRNRARVCALARPNVSIRVVDISKYISGLEFYTWAHFTPHTYYRLLAPDIFAAYDKLVYLDSDTVVNRDIADLYAEDVDGWLMAAALDTQVLAMCGGSCPDPKQVAYFRDTLGLKDYSHYFQGGVALYNLREFRKTFAPGHLIRMALSHQYKWFDQDLLNVQCEGRIKALANNWNTTPASTLGFFHEFHLPSGDLEAYAAARRDPWIVHYIDRRLPSMVFGADLEEYFWKYARQSPFYEALLSKLTEVALDKRDAPVQDRLKVHDYRLSVLEDCTPMRLWRRIAGVIRKCRGFIRRGSEDGC